MVRKTSVRLPLRARIALVVTLILVGVLGVVWYMNSASGTSITVFAQEITAECSGRSSSQACYEENVPRLLDQLSVEKVFDVIREIRRKDPSYQFCHVLAHELGSREVAKDPSKWMDVIARNPTDGLCSNGFIHGAALERFNKDVFSEDELEKEVIPDLQQACDERRGWTPSELDRAMCYHGLGHLSVHLTDADIPTALQLCEEVANHGTGDFRQVCYEGVFMQLFQPLEPEDYALIDLLPEKPTRENLDRICSGRGSEADAACWREGWPFYHADILTASGMEGFCSREENPRYKSLCYSTTVTILGRFSLDNPERSSAVCNELPDERQGNCFSRVAMSFVEEDRTAGDVATRFCGRAENPDVVDQCHEFLLRHSTFIYRHDDPNRDSFCSAFPREEQRENCLVR